jgi:hypothetical protein
MGAGKEGMNRVHTKNSSIRKRYIKRTVCGLVVLVLAAASSSLAYERYKNDAEDAGSNCSLCHGDFTDGTSTKGSVFPGGDKHSMHNSGSAMDAACGLCHTQGDSRNPFLGSSDGTANNPGLGCNGCHDAEGLRAHHMVNNVTIPGGLTCATCHPGDGTPPAEDQIPPYYGTADTNVDDPLNSVQAANTGENWTIGDFLGTDNDGDNLYDMADFDGGYPLVITDESVAGNDVQITWASAKGRCEVLQQVDSLGTNFVDVGSVITNSGVGQVTNDVTIAGGAASPSNRFFRVRYTYPAPVL